MRLLITACLILFCLTNCSSIKVQTKMPYQSREFHSSNLKTGGMALLPTTNKEYDSAVQQNAEHYLHPYVGREYLRPRLVGQLLNETNTLSIYRDAIETYKRTGITDRKKFRQIGAALQVRYLLKIDPGMITTQQETESSTSFYDDDIDINTTETRKNTTSAIIIDCNSGEVVWEGITKATAGEGDLFNRHADLEIIGKNVSALMEQLFF